MRKFLLPIMTLALMWGCKSDQEKETEPLSEQILEVEDTAQVTEFEVNPISHATLSLNWDARTTYVDPVGGQHAFAGQPNSDLVLITDIHGDHLDPATLAALELKETPIIAPQAVKEQLPDSLSSNLEVLPNGQMIDLAGFTVEAIPMYNLREEAKDFHPKGRGNGYLLERNGHRVYIAGDTEDVPEMRDLKNIDVAFIPMNLPYTMTVEKAADAVLDFAPAKVYPYHFRGQDGMSDVNKFKELVNAANKDIEVILLDWYPEADSTSNTGN